MTRKDELLKDIRVSLKDLTEDELFELMAGLARLNLQRVTLLKRGMGIRPGNNLSESQKRLEEVVDAPAVPQDH